MIKSINYLNLIKFIFLLQHVLCNEQLPDIDSVSLTVRQLPLVNEDLDWKLKNLQHFNFTQVPGIAINGSQLNIFHRSTMIWDQNSFDPGNIYKHQDQPIVVDPILTFNLSGDFLSSWGRNHFFMPHGISFDSEGNVWLTDVALHQVFRFNKNNLTQPDLVMGQRFIPGEDENSFCKPTDVQVSTKANLVYVSDGYCNSRVLTFNKDGEFIKQFGIELRMFVPHSLSLIEELDLICVADRQKSRILCFTAGIRDLSKLGELKKYFTSPFQGLLYAIQNIGTHLFGVVNYGDQPLNRGLLFDLTKDKNELVWDGDLFLNTPHDVTVDSDLNLYISEIGTSETKLKMVKRFATHLLQTVSNHLKTGTLKNSLVPELMATKLKRIDDTRRQEEDLRNLATTTTTEMNHAAEFKISQSASSISDDPKSKRNSLLLFIVFISSFILISAILFALKKRNGIENYLRTLGLPTKVIYSKDLHINDPERCGFNLLREEEENLFDFELENSSESEVEEFNFKHVRKA